MSAQPQQIKTPQQQFAEYVEHGLLVVPIKPHIETGEPLKGPEGINAIGWNLRENCISRVEDILATMTQGGLAHLYSNTCAFDLDDLEKARAHFKEHDIDIDALLSADDAVGIDSGREGRGKLLYRISTELGPQLRHINRQDLGYELRCATRPDEDGNIKTVQDVLPPSIHPETLQARQCFRAPG